MASQPPRASQAIAASRKPPKIRQACDCCHARKIRCDGTIPCANCQTTNLSCTYLAIPKKKGPKGPSSRTPRAVLKMQMRQEQLKQPETLLADVRPKSSPSHSSPSRDQPISPDILSRGFEPSPLLTMQVAEQHLESFFAHKYPVTPILHRDRIYHSLKDFHTSPEIYALVTSMSAAVISQTQPDVGSVSSPQSSTVDPLSTPDFFINEAKRARTYREYVEKPTLSDVQTSFFIFATLFNADRHNSAWFSLREAITMLQMLRLHEEDTYEAMEDKIEALFSRRTFWLLFITERAYALQRHRPLTLQRTISLPDVSHDDSDALIISGFLDLVSLFQNFDDSFVSLWNFSTRTASMPFADADVAAISATQLSALQTILAMSIPDVNKRTEVQQADLLISRQWLKTMVWQLCVTKGLLSSVTMDESMSFHYPVAIARDVVSVSHNLHREAFEPHGPGILEKVFDIGCSLADVLQLHPNSPHVLVPGIQVGPKDYLMEMLRLMSNVFGGSSRYLSMLASKADECLHVGIRGSLENGNGHINNNMINGINSAMVVGGARVVELLGDEDPQSGTSDITMSAMTNFDGVGGDGGVNMFDFGALSEASMAWLGSMAEDSFAEYDVVPQDMTFRIAESSPF